MLGTVRIRVQIQFLAFKHIFTLIDHHFANKLLEIGFHQRKNYVTWVVPRLGSAFALIDSCSNPTQIILFSSQFFFVRHFTYCTVACVWRNTRERALIMIYIAVLSLPCSRLVQWEPWSSKKRRRKPKNYENQNKKCITRKATDRANWKKSCPQWLCLTISGSLWCPRFDWWLQYFPEEEKNPPNKRLKWNAYPEPKWLISFQFRMKVLKLLFVFWPLNWFGLAKEGVSRLGVVWTFLEFCGRQVN